MLAEKERQEELYCTYITDCLYSLSRNTAAMGGGGGVKARYVDLLHPSPPDTRTPEDRFMDTIHSLGFKVVRSE